MAVCDAGGAEVISAPPQVGCSARRELIPVGPFLEFCAKRERQIRCELNSCPAITASVGGYSKPAGVDSVTRLVMSFGWEPDAGIRKLNRWRHPNRGEGHSGWADRAEIEDALRSASADIEDLYPGLPVSSRWPVRLGQHRRMTDAQVIAAHTVYVKARMTTLTLAELIWQRYGYASVGSCRQSLTTAFRGLGLSPRQCAATTRHGHRCRKQPGRDCDFCPEHDAAAVHPSQVAVAARQRSRNQILAFEQAA